MKYRQNKLLKSIVEEYVKTAEPVGSNLLVDKYFNNISSATIRNEMAELEKQGLIAQPHISAGRIPTEAGYKFYLDSFSKNTDLKKIIDFDNLDNPKDIAKKVAEISNQAVFVSFGKNDVYYTGIANVFSQPEFHEYNLVCNFSAVVDHLDEIVFKIYDEVTSEVETRIGSENPLSPNCGLIIARNNDKMIGIFGPMRMNYRKNINLIKYAKELI